MTERSDTSTLDPLADFWLPTVPMLETERQELTLIEMAAECIDPDYEAANAEWAAEGRDKLLDADVVVRAGIAAGSNCY